MDSRKLLLFPTAAIVWAQQTPPAAEEAKQALIARVRQYYQLMQEKKYRQAEAMVADESKDDYYNGKKPDIKGFDITRVELTNDQSKATVTVKMKLLMLMPGVGAQIFDLPTPTYWKFENEEWRWYMPEEAKHATPFGSMKTNQDGTMADLTDGKGKAPPLQTLLSQVKIDKTAVTLSTEKPDDTVVIENGLPGPLTLRLDPHAEQIPELTVRVERLVLEPGQKATVTFHWTGEGKVSDTVEITTFPINRALDIEVRTK